MSKIDFLDGGCGGHLGFSIGLYSYFCLISTLYTHHQVSIQLDYREDVQNMTSTFFPYKYIGPIQMHGEANLTLL